MITTMAMPSLRDSSFISCRICAWMVTSSAVVGSSAMMSLGLHASPIAIITRWRMPPENWCGYWPSRRGASEMPTIRRSSTARSRASASLIPLWMNSGSMICSPMVSTGLSEVIGSWKIIEMSRPRMARISSSDRSEEVAAFEQHAPVRDASGGLREQAHDGERGHRFAASRLAHQRHHLARVDAPAHAFHRAHDAARSHEVNVQVLDRKQRRAGGAAGIVNGSAGDGLIHSVARAPHGGFGLRRKRRKSRARLTVCCEA